MIPSRPTRLKRFYKTVSTRQVADNQWQILLDDRVLRTPMKADLPLATQALAHAVAAEWDAQTADIIPESMPMMQFVSAAGDYVTQYRADVTDETLEYAATDSLCYRIEDPAELADRQHEQWQPHLDWALQELGVKLLITSGIFPIQQPQETLDNLRAELDKLPLLTLTAVWLMAKHCGSLVLAFAVLKGRLKAEDAYAVSRLEVNFQNERWGEDEEAREKRESGEREMAAIDRFLGLI